MSLLSKLFGNNINKKTEVFAEKVFGISMVLGQTVIEEFEELSDKPLQIPTYALSAGALNVIDRQLFLTNPEKRNVAMDNLTSFLCNYFDEIFENSVSNKSVREVMLGKFRASQSHLGQFKKYSAKDGEPLKDTFMWEYGKFFSNELSDKDDPVLITLGSSLLTKLLIELDIKKFIDDIS